MSVFSNLPGRVNAGIDEKYWERKRRKSVAVHVSAILLATMIALMSMRHLEAQTKIQFYSLKADMNGGRAPQECYDEAKVLSDLINVFPHPTAWTWIIACDEESWRSMEMKLGVLVAAQQQNKEIFAETDRHYKRTFIRGTTLLHTLVGFNEMTPERIVAHELGHIQLDTGDEGDAEDQAHKWIRDRQRAPRIMTASLQ